jgi:hypothetical protein
MGPRRGKARLDRAMASGTPPQDLNLMQRIIIGTLIGIMLLTSLLPVLTQVAG